MPGLRASLLLIVPALLAVAAGAAISATDKYALQVPGGLAFAEFKGYESWQVISLSQNERFFTVIVGNPAMIAAYQAGIPGNGKPFPDGAKMAKIHWQPKASELAPTPVKVAGPLHDIDFMVKDSARFADSGGWGYGAFQYDGASGAFRPSTEADQPPQEHDAKCGFACHSIAQARDYVFTEYAKR
ncbi:MAG: cytochrome P460 family protein [Hyphomicrobium sp.]